MKWCRDIYVGDSVVSKKRKILHKLKHNKFQINCHVIILPLTDGGIMEIYPAYIFLQDFYKKQNIYVIGLAGDKGEAYELAGRIAMDCYHATDAFDVKRYIYERQGGHS